MSTTSIVSLEQIANKIYHVRDVKVMLDRDLAELYEVETGNPAWKVMRLRVAP